MNTDQWRVGNHNARNLYIGDEHVAVTVGESREASGLAHRIVAAMNHTCAPAKTTSEDEVKTK